MLQALPAAFGELAPGVGESGRGADLPVLPRGGLLVALAIERLEHALAEAGALFEHCLRRVGAGVLEAGHGGHLVEAGKFGHAEQHVL